MWVKPSNTFSRVYSSLWKLKSSTSWFSHFFWVAMNFSLYLQSWSIQVLNFCSFFVWLLSKVNGRFYIGNQSERALWALIFNLSHDQILLCPFHNSNMGHVIVFHPNKVKKKKQLSGDGNFRTKVLFVWGAFWAKCLMIIYIVQSHAVHLSLWNAPFIMLPS